VTAPTQSQIVTTTVQPSTTIQPATSTTTTVVAPNQEFVSKGQDNIEVSSEYSTVVTRPAETIVTTSTTTAAPRVASSNVGFGLQVGSFVDYNNAMIEMNKLQHNNINNLLVNAVLDKNGKTVYKLIIGPFSHRSEVEQYKVLEPSKYNSKAFIVDLSKMN